MSLDMIDLSAHLLKSRQFPAESIGDEVLKLINSIVDGGRFVILENQSPLAAVLLN